MKFLKEKELLKEEMKRGEEKRFQNFRHVPCLQGDGGQKIVSYGGPSPQCVRQYNREELT